MVLQGQVCQALGINVRHPAKGQLNLGRVEVRPASEKLRYSKIHANFPDSGRNSDFGDFGKAGTLGSQESRGNSVECGIARNARVAARRVVTRRECKTRVKRSRVVNVT
jgi:hypothetical protein